MSTKVLNLPSVERPWMKFYPDFMQDIKVPECKISEFLAFRRADVDESAIDYYGDVLSYRDLLQLASRIKKSLLAFGVRPDDQIVVFMESSPVFLALLFACEDLGVSIVCRDGTVPENIIAVHNSKAKLVFVSDTTSEELQSFLNISSGVTVIRVDMFSYHSMPVLPDYAKRTYEAARNHLKFGTSFEEFLEKGKDIKDVEFYFDCNRPLLRCYTTGTTGMSKQVIHSSHTILGVVCQMTFFTRTEGEPLKWLQACLPPSLVACIVSMQLMPLANDNLLVLDPYCAPENIDQAILHHKANCMALIPMFIDVLLHSKYITEDTDLSFIKQIGAGAEAMNDRQILQVHDFLKSHKCEAKFAFGYGLSEAGSNLTLPHPTEPVTNCCYGMPMPLVVMGIFDENNNELGYNQAGYVCCQTPGMMLSYGGLTYDMNDKNTSETLVRHKDGKLWLHTGDIGTISEDGAVHILNRGFSYAEDGTQLDALPLENKCCFISGISDMFFVTVQNPDNDSYSSYLYVVPDGNFEMNEFTKKLHEVLSPAEYPKRIYVIHKRPYFHFKTARKRLMQEIRQEMTQ